jgi:hypothetical protein
LVERDGIAILPRGVLECGKHGASRHGRILTALFLKNRRVSSVEPPDVEPEAD